MNQAEHMSTGEFVAVQAASFRTDQVVESSPKTLSELQKELDVMFKRLETAKTLEEYLNLLQSSNNLSFYCRPSVTQNYVSFKVSELQRVSDKLISMLKTFDVSLSAKIVESSTFLTAALAKIQVQGSDEGSLMDFPEELLIISAPQSVDPEQTLIFHHLKIPVSNHLTPLLQKELRKIFAVHPQPEPHRNESRNDYTYAKRTSRLLSQRSAQY